MSTLVGRARETNQGC